MRNLQTLKEAISLGDFSFINVIDIVMIYIFNNFF